MKKLLKLIALALWVISISNTKTMAQSEQEIDQEIASLLSSGGNLLNLDNIQNSVLSQLSSLLTSQLAASLGSSPISEVTALKGVISESYLKQQKMISTQIQIEQEKNLSMTSISSQLANYYNELGFSTRFSDLASKTSVVKRKIQESRVINPSTKDLLIAVINKNNLCSELKGKIRTATNQNGQVWMSEAERAQLLNEASTELDRKVSLLNVLEQRVFKIETDFNRQQLRRSKTENLIK